MTEVRGQVVDLAGEVIFPGAIHFEDGRIVRVERIDGEGVSGFLIPGFVDAHIHIESSMLAPAEFSRAVTVQGTVATISDPHEIANVLGIPGIEYMIAESARAPLKVFYGAPPCVPATAFETAGAALDAKAVGDLLARGDIHYLSEVMNFPGVLAGDPELLAKIRFARERGKPVDGHAPRLRHPAIATYAAAGITTDHECSELDEALEKISAGMKILIREGSAARNYEALEPLLFSHPESCMFCSDDLHPDAIEHGHINRLVRRAVAAGVSPFAALRVASVNPVRHYGFPIGLLRVGDPADFLVVEDLRDFAVRQTWIQGVLVAEKGRSFVPFQSPAAVNRFEAKPVVSESLRIPCAGEHAIIEVIAVEDGQLVTGRETHELAARGGALESDVERDILKIVVVNRYDPAAPPAAAFVRNFGLAAGAIASSVAHDSHNIIAVGVDDPSLCRAINLVVENRGGVCAVNGAEERILPLPIAGLMSDRDAVAVARSYAAVEELARQSGSSLRAPLMTLSFLALLVIPELKLSDRGLFDGARFALTPLCPKGG